MGLNRLGYADGAVDLGDRIAEVVVRAGLREYCDAGPAPAWGHTTSGGRPVWEMVDPRNTN